MYINHLPMNTSSQSYSHIHIYNNSIREKYMQSNSYLHETQFHLRIKKNLKVDEAWKHQK